ncbi:hypothetical protein Prubr_72770 [Polymorphospora rubra]|uniref:Uncharacterized protein n=1 Tax=Polymorphospora rubra TaxID=338584 RepID=A0A810NA27_9ACTN|nr:hypothetical protein Prubr_72770 [Polymorphospora rubra]
MGASAGEGTAIVTGRGQPDIADIDGLGPYCRDGDLVILGVRDHDEQLDEVRGLGITVHTTPEIAAAITDTLVAALRG